MPKPNQEKNSEPTTGLKESLVVCANSQGLPLHAGLLKLSRHQVVFEIFTPFTVLRLSEALNDFRVLSGDRVLYSGRAVVSNLLPTNTTLVCEANLEDAWCDLQLSPTRNGGPKMRAEFQQFIRNTQGAFKILPEFKLVVADLQILLQDLRHWLEQVELSVLAQPAGSRQQCERELIQELQEPITPMLGLLFEKLEASCRSIAPDSQPAHRTYIKRQLHPLVLCAPFMYRTFRKPLGYAGDYEMVNMMLRDPREGASVFAKVLNTFFLSTPPVVAHRNRIEYLKTTLVQETARVLRQGRSAKIFNLGCGPAKEIQEFIAQSELSPRAQFTLLDFNDETIAYTGQLLNQIMDQSGHKVPVQLVRRSVVQVLKEAAKPNSSLLTSDYDLVYCAGLFDYLPQNICQRPMAIFYRMLAPDGLLVATNVDKCNPSRNWMEYSVDWHLVYRDCHDMTRLVPESAPPDSFRIFSEPSGVNTMIEIRKPKHA